MKFKSLLQQLFELNRSCFHQTRQLKKELAERKATLDSKHLVLQNLKYERFHLEKEISLTDAFETIYQTIDLISEEKFEAEAPKDLLDNEAALEDSSKQKHQRMLNRLTFELNERKRLSQVIEELQHKKLKLSKEIRGSENEVTKLDKELDALLTVRRSISSFVQKRVFSKNSIKLVNYPFTKAIWTPSHRKKKRGCSGFFVA